MDFGSDDDDDEENASSSRGLVQDPVRYEPMDVDRARGDVSMSRNGGDEDEEVDEIDESSEEEVLVDEPPLVRESRSHMCSPDP